MSERRPSGLPGGRVFPGAPGFEYDHESEVTEASLLIRNLRRSMLVAAVGVAILVAAFLIGGNANAARGVMNLLGVPVLVVLLLNEVLAFFQRRRTRTSNHADG